MLAVGVATVHEKNPPECWTNARNIPVRQPAVAKVAVKVPNPNVKNATNSNFEEVLFPVSILRSHSTLTNRLKHNIAHALLSYINII